MNKVVYVADIEQDIDDLVAIELLVKTDMLKGVVLDPEKGRDKLFEYFPQIKIFKDIKESDCDIVFCGGATTKIAKHLDDSKIKLLVMNGGFVQQPLDKERLSKFKDKKSIRTYNFNLDVNSTVKMINSPNLEKVILVGKNVCHSIRNTKIHIHKDLETNFKLRDDKRLHDVLMVQEGIRYLNNEEMACEYINGKPKNKGIKGTHTEWYTDLDRSGKFMIANKIK